MVVEDSADTLGATLRGRSTGTRSHISTTSFYGSHVINAGGNGGMLCVNDDELARRALLLRSWGRTSSLFVESETIENRFNVVLDGISYDAKFMFEELGYNVEPSEMGAAFGLVQLDKLEQNIVARERNFQRQREFFQRTSNGSSCLSSCRPRARAGWPFRSRSGPMHRSIDATCRSISRSGTSRPDPSSQATSCASPQWPRSRRSGARTATAPRTR